MKLRNKDTGEIVKLVGYVKTGDDRMFFRFEDDRGTYKKEYNSLAELNAEWEDYEEPKEYWYIDDAGVIQIDQVLASEINMRKSIGNYFETEEEAKKAVEKLKAWKRLKDKGFRFDNFVRDAIYFNLDEEQIQNKSVLKDLDLLFGGEE